MPAPDRPANADVPDKSALYRGPGIAQAGRTEYERYALKGSEDAGQQK